MIDSKNFLNTKVLFTAPNGSAFKWTDSKIEGTLTVI
jgi:hypothetical protein